MEKVERVAGLHYRVKRITTPKSLDDVNYLIDYFVTKTHTATAMCKLPKLALVGFICMNIKKRVIATLFLREKVSYRHFIYMLIFKVDAVLNITDDIWQPFYNNIQFLRSKVRIQNKLQRINVVEENPRAVLDFLYREVGR